MGGRADARNERPVYGLTAGNLGLRRVGTSGSFKRPHQGVREGNGGDEGESVPGRREDDAPAGAQVRRLADREERLVRDRADTEKRESAPRAADATHDF